MAAGVLMRVRAEDVGGLLLAVMWLGSLFVAGGVLAWRWLTNPHRGGRKLW